MTKSSITFCRALGVGIAVGVLFAFLFHTGLFETLELKTLDFRFSKYADRLTPSKDIVIVTIDQNSIDYLKYKMGIVWKWPRDVYANVIKYLERAQAKAILLDFDFSDPDINRAEFEEGETDRVLGSAIKDSGIVINSALFYRRPVIGRFGGDDTDYNMLKRFAIDVIGKENIEIEGNQSVIAPISPVMQYSRGLGATNLYPDRDGIIRKARLFQGFRDDIFANSALSSVLSALNIEGVEINKSRIMVKKVRDKDYKMRPDSHTVNPVRKKAQPELSKGVKLDNRGEVYINWYGPGGPDSNTYKYFPIADILLSYIRQEDGLQPIVAPEEFRDKIVLIGSNAPSLYDLKPTPFSNEEAYPGVEIIATIINNLLDGNSLSRVDGRDVIFLIFIACILTSFIVSFVRSAFKNVLLTLLLMLGVYYSAVALFYNNLFLSLVPIETGIFFSFTVVTLINYLTEGREKKWIKKAFSHYLPASVITEIIKNPEKLKLGGEKKEGTILFADIRGFTSISEKLEPEEVADILNECFTPMTEIICRYNGTLDKYMGDAIMTFFGAPLPLRNHQTYACYAALDMIVLLNELKQKWKDSNMPEYIQHMNIGIGINSGLVSVGNMGSVSRFDYTVIGDEVNLSSRLECLNKTYGTNIIVSDNTYRHTKDKFIYRELDYIKVAGKDIPVKIYELVKRKEGGG